MCSVSEGNRKQGYEYQVAVWEDYEALKSGIGVVDEILEKLKGKAALKRSKAPSSQNGSPQLIHEP